MQLALILVEEMTQIFYIQENVRNLSRRDSFVIIWEQLYCRTKIYLRMGPLKSWLLFRVESTTLVLDFSFLRDLWTNWENFSVISFTIEKVLGILNKI